MQEKRKLIDTISEKMDENELFKIILNNSIVAFIVTLVLVIVGVMIVKYGLVAINMAIELIMRVFLSLSKDIPTPTGISIIITIIAVYYVFYRHKQMADMCDRIFNAFVCVLIASMYYFVTYLAGEAIVISLVLLGTLITFSFLLGEIVFTSGFTYMDLVEWANKNDDCEDKQKDEQNLNPWR